MAASTIFDALAMAQRTIKNPPLDGKNPHFRSRYATLGRCLEAVRGPLAEQGIAVSNGSDVQDGVLTVWTVLARGSESVDLARISVPAPAKVQELGSAITYLRRYSLCAALGIVGEDDDDGNAAQQAERPAPKPPPRPESDALTEALKAAGCKSKSDADAVCAFVAGTRDRGVPSDPTERRELSVVVVEAANARQPGGLLAEARAWLAEGA
jgi:hypothetical protein